MLFGVALASGEEMEGVPTEVEDDSKQPDSEEPVKEAEGASKTQEKRGLFRVTGVHGENLQPYQFVYPVPQQAAAYQPQQMPQYEPRSVGSLPSPTILKPYPMPYAQPTYQQQYVINSPSPAPHVPIPYSSHTPMILLMMPPHPGNPYGSLMLLPYNNIVPQYNPNNIVPQYTPNNIVPNRVPFQYVPQYVPVPVKGYGQAPGFSSAHFKTSEYSQKPSVGPQYLSSQNYQEQPQSSEEQDSGVTSAPNYVSRRPVEYVKG